MNTEHVALAIGALILLYVLARFGRSLARVVIALVILAAILAVALAFRSQAEATRQTAQALRVATVSQSTATVASAFCAGGALAAVLGVAGLAGWFWLRLRVGQYRARLPRRIHKALPHARPLDQAQEPPEVIYIVTDKEPVDLELWGFDAPQEVRPNER